MLLTWLAARPTLAAAAEEGLRGLQLGGPHAYAATFELTAFDILVRAGVGGRVRVAPTQALSPNPNPDPHPNQLERLPSGLLRAWLMELNTTPSLAQVRVRVRDRVRVRVRGSCRGRVRG